MPVLMGTGELETPMTCRAIAEAQPRAMRDARRHAETDFHSGKLPFEALLCGRGRALSRKMLRMLTMSHPTLF